MRCGSGEIFYNLPAMGADSVKISSRRLAYPPEILTFVFRNPKHIPIMNTHLSVNQLWDLAQTLSTDNRRWLADKLYQSVKEEEEHLTPYTMEEINAWIDESLADIKAGRVLTEEEANKEMEEYLATL